MNTETLEQPGIDILNVGTGDVKIVFETEEDIKKAKQMIPDMLKRGFAVLIEVEGAWQRIHDFDAKTGEYVIKGQIKPTQSGADKETEPVKAARPKRYNMGKVKATVVGRSAGG